MLGVSIDTLRRWDRKGSFSAIRTPGGHRYYSPEQLSLFKEDLLTLAKSWVTNADKTEPKNEFYCPNSIVFQSRLMRLEKELLETFAGVNHILLVSAAVGEIGNNSFDHNIGNWRDIPGIFFGYDLRKRQVVLADRGQGVLTTLRHVKPELATDKEALHTAFTEVISGRAPEARGNGLKLVKLIVERNPLSVDFYSGDAAAALYHDKDMNIRSSTPAVSGCIAFIRF